MLNKNIIFIYICIAFLIWIFINNFTQNLFTSLLVLLILVVLFLCYYFISKKFFKLVLFIIIWISIWIWVSQYNLNIIKLKENILNPYYDNKNKELIIEIKNINKIDEFKIEYLAKINEINSISIEKKIYCLINGRNY